MMGDHPDIRAALRSGYSGYARQCLCPRCGYDIGERSFGVEGEYICLQGFTEWVTDYLNTNPEEIAEALFVPVSYLG